MGISIKKPNWYSLPFNILHAPEAHALTKDEVLKIKQFIYEDTVPSAGAITRVHVMLYYPHQYDKWLRVMLSRPFCKLTGSVIGDLPLNLKYLELESPF